MQFNSKTAKLTLTKREQQTLADAVKILSDAGRILGDAEICKPASELVALAVERLAPKEAE